MLNTELSWHLYSKFGLYSSKSPGLWESAGKVYKQFATLASNVDSEDSKVTAMLLSVFFPAGVLILLAYTISFVSGNHNIVYTATYLS